LGKVRILLLLLDSLLGGLCWSQSSADGSGLFLSEVNWDESFALVLLSQLGFDGLVVDSQHTGDGFTNNTNFGQLGGSTTGDFGNTKLKTRSQQDRIRISLWFREEEMT
jgi:hypothetical protein